MGIGDAFAEGFSRFKRYLRSSFSALNEYDAEDIVQQVAAAMLCRTTDGIGNATAYIYAGLRNAAMSHFRRQKHEAPMEDMPEGVSESPEQAALDAELSQELTAALMLLDEKSRFVFVETTLHGRSYRELSEQTGEPVGTLLSRRSRAVKKLSVILKDYLQ